MKRHSCQELNQSQYRTRFMMHFSLAMTNAPFKSICARSRPVIIHASSVPTSSTSQRADPLLRPLCLHYVFTPMPWVDGPNNPWRNLMIPLALKSQSLLLALLALSDEHYPSQLGPDWPVHNGFSSNTYRDRSLQVLAREQR